MSENVADFGAVPDGETDCTAAFQAAINQADGGYRERMAAWKRERRKPWTATFWRWAWFGEQPRGPVVYLPPGTYMIGGASIPARMTLTGSGGTTVTTTALAHPRKSFWSDSRPTRRLGYWRWCITSLWTREDDDWDDDDAGEGSAP